MTTLTTARCAEGSHAQCAKLRAPQMPCDCSCHKAKVRILEVKRCLDCPHHTMVSDPGSDDSFDASDQAMVCKLTGPYKAPDRKFDHRPIVRCERWQSRFEKAEIPDWCPLPEA